MQQRPLTKQCTVAGGGRNDGKLCGGNVWISFCACKPEDLNSGNIIHKIKTDPLE